MTFVVNSFSVGSPPASAFMRAARSKRMRSSFSPGLIAGDRKKRRSGFFPSAITCGLPPGAKSGAPLTFVTERQRRTSSRETGWLNVTVATACCSAGVVGSM